MEAIGCSTPPWSRWADLPADLLRDVSGRLHDAPDLVRFHAVCQSWRDADFSPATTVLLPCLLTRHGNLVARYHLDFRCVDSPAEESSHRHCDLLDVPFRHDLLLNWVTADDGTAVFFLTTGSRSKLINLITGAVTPLPRLPRDASSIAHPRPNSRGIVYGDGTVFLYNLKYNYLCAGGNYYTDLFTAAVLRPGDATWLVLKKSIGLWPAILIHDLYAAYHDGNVVLCVGPTDSAYVMTMDGGGCVVATRTSHPMDGSVSQYSSDHSYILESGGELLWVTVKAKHDGGPRDRAAACPSMSVVVDALESAPEAGKMLWVRRDGRSLGDRVLFLGCPYSFAMDAAQLGIAGGCAYLVFNPAAAADSSLRPRSRVVRCNLVDGETTCVKVLSSSARHEQTWTWLRPQLAVAPIHDIRNRLQTRNSNKIFHRFHYKTRLRRPGGRLSKFMGRFRSCVKF